MNKAYINGLTYKLGLHNKYYYLASDGTWLLASEQIRIKQSFDFNLLPRQDQQMSMAAKARLMIIDVMQDLNNRTPREIAKILNIKKAFAKCRIEELVKSGQVKRSGMARCSIINRTVPAYKLA